jgi:hypothetical protein
VIRFIPDSWLEAVLRPLAMATPESWVYVEFIAPDLRFLAAALLVLVLAIAVLRGSRAPKPVLVLVSFMAVAFAVWTATSGNGRYGMPLLLAVGPLCIGLLYVMPWTRAFRLTVAVLLVAVQGLVVAQNDPWGWWGLTPWRDVYFEVDLPADVVQRPGNYVTLSSISYSLIAPRFHPRSRWINLSKQGGIDDQSRDAVRTREFLAAAHPLTLLFPSLPEEQAGPPRISAQLLHALNGLLARHLLAINDLPSCRFLPSRSLSLMNARQSPPGAGKGDPKLGFWLCPLRSLSGRPPAAAATGAQPVAGAHSADSVFNKIEKTCPRLFPPGGAMTLSIPNGFLRSYGSSDMKLYVLADGTVAYKYLRALNPEIIGNVNAIEREGFQFECDHIHGRGAPWDREL